MPASRSKRSPRSSVAGALALVWRETRSVRSLVFVGLNPAIIISVVNGGHNDALVGLAVLAAGLLAARRRFGGAGFVLALGLLVKASAGVGLIGIAAWTLTRDRRGAVRLLAVATVTTVVASLPAGFVATRNAIHAGNGNTHASVWDPITTATNIKLTIVLVLVLALATFAAYVRRDRPQPSAPALASMAAYLTAGAYVLPWYSAWALPTAALERRSRLAWLVALQSVFLLAVYEFELPAHPSLKGFLAGVRTGIVQLGAWALLAAFLVIILGVRGRRVAERPAEYADRQRRARNAPYTPITTPSAAPPKPRTCCWRLISRWFAMPPTRSAASAPADARNQPAVCEPERKPLCSSKPPISASR